MKMSDIRKTISVLEEVDFIISSFHGIATPLANRYFRLHFLLETLRPARELSGLIVG